MLKHVIEAEILDSVVRSVDLVVRILKVRFDNERGWVSSLGS